MCDSHEETDNGDVDESNFRKLHEKVSKVGYADGVTAGEKSVFQISFDQGYVDGLRTGIELEKYRAFCTATSNIKNHSRSDLVAEANAYEIMNIPETTKSDHFQFNIHKDGETLNSISKHQNEYLNKLVANFQEKLPQTSNLLS